MAKYIGNELYAYYDAYGEEVPLSKAKFFGYVYYPEKKKGDKKKKKKPISISGEFPRVGDTVDKKMFFMLEAFLASNLTYDSEIRLEPAAPAISKERREELDFITDTIIEKVSETDPEVAVEMQIAKEELATDREIEDIYAEDVAEAIREARAVDQGFNVDYKPKTITSIVNDEEVKADIETFIFEYVKPISWDSENYFDILGFMREEFAPIIADFLGESIRGENRMMLRLNYAYEHGGEEKYAVMPIKRIGIKSEDPEEAADEILDWAERQDDLNQMGEKFKSYMMKDFMKGGIDILGFSLENLHTIKKGGK